MANYSIALLRFKWRDQANAIPTWPDFAYTGCYLPIRPKGVARYWQERTFGLANLEGSIVYPWRVLDLDTPNSYLGREVVIRNAIERGLDEGFPLHDFERVVVVVIPNTRWTNGVPSSTIDGGALPSIQLRGGSWTTALLAEDYEFDNLAHEVGHVLGLEHPWQFVGQDAEDYGSPYCVMSSARYGREKSWWVSSADSALPVPSVYWSMMSPRPAAATLLKFLPAFEGSGFVSDLGTNFASVPRSVILHAPDTGRKPVAAFVTNQATGKRYVVEYRRATGWDQGVVPGVVLHSIDPAAPKPEEPVIYEGRIRTDVVGDQDVRSRDKEITVLLDEVTDSDAAVKVTVGGATLIEQVNAAIDIQSGGQSWLYEEGTATIPIPPVCGEGTFKFYIDHQETVLVCRARAYGFDDPEFFWSVNSVNLPLAATTSANLSLFNTSVDAAFPRPNGELREIRDAAVLYDIADSTLTLTASAEDGNYPLSLEVEVKEKGADPAAPTAHAIATGQMTGVIVRYEQSYYDAVEDCVRKIRDVADRFAESKRLSPFILGGPILRNLSVLRAWRSEVEAKNPSLARQLDHAIRVLSGRLAAPGSSPALRGEDT